MKAAGVSRATRGLSRRVDREAHLRYRCASGALLLFVLPDSDCGSDKGDVAGRSCLQYGTVTNRRFKIYKFRTMRADAGDARGVKQAVKGDARVTPIGRICENQLDEIPQLINVIKAICRWSGRDRTFRGCCCGSAY